MQKLSKRQQMIFDFIQNEVELKGYPPSVREIAKAVGLASSSTVHGHLERIENKGYIRRDPTKPRAIELLNENTNYVEKDSARYVPVIGTVTATSAITRIANSEDLTAISCAYSLSTNQLLVIVVEGDSMVNAGILDNVRVMVKQQNTTETGYIVVAMTADNEATINRFYKE